MYLNLTRGNPGGNADSPGPSRSLRIASNYFFMNIHITLETSPGPSEGISEGPGVLYNACDIKSAIILSEVTRVQLANYFTQEN